jgi:hypothetical protein
MQTQNTNSLGVPKVYLVYIEDGLGGKLDSAWSLRRLAEQHTGAIAEQGESAGIHAMVLNEAPKLPQPQEEILVVVMYPQRGIIGLDGKRYEWRTVGCLCGLYEVEEESERPRGSQQGSGKCGLMKCPSTV